MPRGLSLFSCAREGRRPLATTARLRGYMRARDRYPKGRDPDPALAGSTKGGSVSARQCSRARAKIRQCACLRSTPSPHQDIPRPSTHTAGTKLRRWTPHQSHHPNYDMKRQHKAHRHSEGQNEVAYDHLRLIRLAQAAGLPDCTQGRPARLTHGSSAAISPISIALARASDGSRPSDLAVTSSGRPRAKSWINSSRAGSGHLLSVVRLIGFPMGLRRSGMFTQKSAEWPAITGPQRRSPARASPCRR